MLLNFTDLTLTSKGELYHTLYTYIKESIEQGMIKKGEKLPSVREAALQLSVSRTTVENAYMRLCIEGYVESIPQKGYYIIGAPITINILQKENATKPFVAEFDFSSRRIDEKASDTNLWKKLMRSVLWDSGELVSYGDPQGELKLREALANYSYKARGVITSADNIIVGAGIGPLLNILCGLLGRDITVGFENNGFFEAERIFKDYGIPIRRLESDSQGATESAIKKADPNVLFLLPSALSKISPAALSARRNFFSDWANKKENRLIIEDDYNGELRYTARSVPAFQCKNPQKTVYIGSFSKLLLPSVRIAYMVLPDFLMKKFKNLTKPYNQTCGKIEQLTLEKYIVSGALEKHLNRLRRLYNSKSKTLFKSLEEKLDSFKSATLFESSITAEIKTRLPYESHKLCEIAHENGVVIMESYEIGSFRLCFAGIDTSQICTAVEKLNKIFGNL